MITAGVYGNACTLLMTAGRVANGGATPTSRGHGRIQAGAPTACPIGSITGQKYTLLSHRENLTLDGRRALKQLLAANKRLNTAYLLKEAFGQLWDYRREGWARRFFENWRAALKWQRLKPYEKFAELIERHWVGIAAYCRPENKVSLGFVEGLNNKIRVIQRRAYGLRDEEYLRLKVLNCMLPKALRSPARASGPGAYHNTQPHRVAWLVTGPHPPRPQRAESSNLQKRQNS